jgi:nucleoid-associated protein YgaU
MSQTVAAVPATRPASSVHLTHRGRLVLIIALMLVGFAVVSLGRAATDAVAADPSVPQSGVATTEWVVQPGETLWSIAESVAPDADPRDTIARIVQLNDLPESSVQAGQTLQIPA